MIPVKNILPEHPLWATFVDHLHRANMAQWVLDKTSQPQPNLFFLVGYVEQAIIGHITLKRQPITIPATEWSGGADTPVISPDSQSLDELFVYTFAVDAEHRRQGLGRTLQLAALDLTRDLGCYQLRSWSSLDKPANYALKISLGFAMHPAILTTDSGLQVNGVYFVKAV